MDLADGLQKAEEHTGWGDGPRMSSPQEDMAVVNRKHLGHRMDPSAEHYCSGAKHVSFNL